MRKIKVFVSIVLTIFVLTGIFPKETLEKPAWEEVARTLNISVQYLPDECKTFEDRDKMGNIIICGSLGTTEDAYNYYTEKARIYSAHFFIDSNGKITQFLPINEKAFMSGLLDDSIIIAFSEEETQISQATSDSLRVLTANLLVCFDLNTENTFVFPGINSYCCSFQNDDAEWERFQIDTSVLAAKILSEYTVDRYFDDNKNEPSASPVEIQTSTQAIELLGDSNEEFIKRVEPLVMEDAKTHRVLPSVSIAQAILESGWGKSKLTQEGNALFGLKSNIGYWQGMTWQGGHKSYSTFEEQAGKTYSTKAGFRTYDSIEESIADHSTYLLYAKRSSGVYRYEGISGCSDFERCVDIIVAGGYATDSRYKKSLLELYEQYNLRQYDDQFLS